MTSLPLRTVVHPNQLATSEDALDWDTVNQHYLLQIVTKLQGQHSEGDPGTNPDPQGLGCIVNGCNVELDVPKGQLKISQGMVLFQQTAVDPASGEARNTKALAICPEQTINLGIKASGTTRYVIVQLTPEPISATGSRKFLDQSSGGTFSQTVEIAKGLRATASVQNTTSRTDPDEVDIGQLNNSSGDAIPIALLFHTDVLDDSNLFDVRPLQSRLPARGEITMSAASHPTDKTRALISFINLSPMHAEPVTSIGHDWLQTVTAGAHPSSLENQHTSTGLATVVLDDETYAANFPLGDYPPLNLVFEDGSFRRTKLRRDGGTLTAIGTELAALPPGLSWLYVYTARSRNNSIPTYIMSLDRPGGTQPLYFAGPQLGGQKFFGTPPQPYNATSLGSSDVKGWCVGLLPIYKGVNLLFPRFRAYGERLYLAESEMDQDAGPLSVPIAIFNAIDVHGLYFEIMSQSEAEQLIPKWGTTKLSISVDCNIETNTSTTQSLYKMSVVVAGRLLSSKAMCMMLLSNGFRGLANYTFEIEVSGEDIDADGIKVVLTPVSAGIVSLLFKETYAAAYIKEVHWPKMGVPVLSGTSLF